MPSRSVRLSSFLFALSSALNATPGVAAPVESVDHTPRFSGSEIDPALKDLFWNGRINLCWPAALAVAMVHQRLEHDPPFSRLLTPPAKASPMPDLIRYFAGACHTDPASGTGAADGIRCIADYYLASGYAADVQVVGVAWGGFQQVAPARHVDRAVSFADLLDGSRRDLGMVLSVGFYVLGAEKKVWNRAFGHAVTVTGFDLAPAAEGSLVTLHVVNPAVDYSKAALKYDPVTISMLVDQRPVLPESPNRILAVNGSTFTLPGGVYLIDNLTLFLPRDRDTASAP